MSIAISFGALCLPLSEQLRTLGIRKERLDLYQRQADAITLLVIQGTLTDGEAHKARVRLAKAIRKEATTKGADDGE